MIACTYRSEYLSFPVSQIISDYFSLNDLLTLGLFKSNNSSINLCKNNMCDLNLSIYKDTKIINPNILLNHPKFMRIILIFRC